MHKLLIISVATVCLLGTPMGMASEQTAPDREAREQRRQEQQEQRQREIARWESMSESERQAEREARTQRRQENRRPSAG